MILYLFMNSSHTVFISHVSVIADDTKLTMNSNSVTVGGFSKIILAIDGSESSRDAAHYAIELANCNSAKLIAITVLHKSLSSYGLAPAPNDTELDKEKRALKAKEWFEKVTHEAESNHINFRTELVDTQLSIESAIVEYAEEEKADLIVMGTRGLSGFKRLLLGSVALGVATYSTCPVLIIK
jgi:nucleotide-binding universal stress UspA family protein